MTSESRSPAVVHDILHYIISYLDPDPYVDPHDPEGRSIRQALARLATTHSTFTQPALSALWRSLPDDNALKHLLCVVGIAKELLHKENGGWPVLELCGTPETHGSSWRRFREYTSLVRKIVVDPCVGESQSSSSSALLYDTLWCQISSILGDTPILPRLNVVHFASFDSRQCPVDSGRLLLLNPSIQELTIEFDLVGTAQETKLRAAFRSCFSSTPNLERLSLIVPCSVLDLESLPQSHPRLRDLRVDTRINSRCLTSIAALPDLESLSIYLSGPTSTPVQFKRLRSLSIWMDGLDDADTLITYMDAPHLRKLSIDSSHRRSLDLHIEVFQCLDALAVRFPSFAAFDWRCLSPRQMTRGSRHPGETLAEFIEPLLSLRTLCDLSLDFNGPIVSYSSVDFCRMAEAWPDLEILDLKLEHKHRAHRSDTGSGSDLVQYADYESFASFSRHCPRLHTLRIPRARIDTVANVPSPPSGSPTSHQLRHLHVHDVLCPDASGPDTEFQRCCVFLEMMKQIFPFAAVHLPGVT